MDIVRLALLFAARGAVLYGVGGAVRNPMLGLPVSDTDVCSRLRPAEVAELAARNGIPCLDRWADFGMVELGLGDAVCQHTTFRSDSYPPGGGHRPDSVAFGDTLCADAFRRDFTVNALYADILTGQVLDPTGGRGDLDKKIIRATSPDPDTIMRSDAVRILRMVRFACELGFGIDPATFAAAGRNVGGLRDISPERVRGELEKILMSDARYGVPGAVLKGLRLLDGLGAMDVILPGLNAGREAFRAADRAAAVLELRLAALLCGGAGSGCSADGAPAGERALKALVRLKFPAAAAARVRELAAHRAFDPEGEAPEDEVRLWLQERGPELSRQLIALRRAERGGGCGPDTAGRWERILDLMERERVPFSQRELDISGGDIMAALDLGPGPLVGRIKRELLSRCALHPGDNRRVKLLRLIRESAKNS